MKNVHYISAGAGSGKTYKLTSLLSGIIKDHKAEPEQVILTTFTNSAAEEFREKAKIALHKEGMHTEAERLDLAKIGTVHSVAESFIRKYWYILGLSPKLKVITDEDLNFYINQSLSTLVLNDDIRFFNKYRKEFSLQKKREGGPGNIPDYGFWKTLLTDLIKNIRVFIIGNSKEIEKRLNESMDYSVKLIDSFVDPKASPSVSKGDILYAIEEELDYCSSHNPFRNSNDGTKEEKLTELISSLQTFKSSVEKDIPDNNGEAFFPSILKSVEIINNLNRQKSVFNNSPTAISVCNHLNSIWQSEPVANLHIDLVKRLVDLSKKWNNEYSEYKIKNHLIDYNDMEYYMVRLLDHKEVVDDISSSYRYLFVDEFQDSSPLQVRIFDKLSDLMADSFWVGDFKQSIYGFRGSDTFLTSAVADVISTGINGCKKESPLERCWRSAPDITYMVNHVFEPLFSNTLHVSDIHLEPSEPQKAAEHYKNLYYWDIQGKVDDYYKGIAKRIAFILSDRYDGKEHFAPKDIAVLCSSNADICKVVNALDSLGVPVSSIGGSVKDSNEAILLLALLSLIVNRNDELAVSTIAYLTEPNFSPGNIIDKKLRFISENEYGNLNKNFLSDLPLVQRLFGVGYSNLKLYSQQSVGGIVSTLVYELDLKGMSRKWDATGRSSRVYDALIANAKAYEDRCLQMSIPSTITGFINYINEDNAALEGNSDGVTVCTIHKSKGLEWKCVIFAASNKESFKKKSLIEDEFFGVHAFYDKKPSAECLYPDMHIRILPKTCGSSVPEPVKDIIRERMDYKELEKDSFEEAKRKTYVALTRAKEYLVIAAPYTVSSKGSRSKLSTNMKWFFEVGIPVNEVNSGSLYNLFGTGDMFIVNQFDDSISEEELRYNKLSHVGESLDFGNSLPSTAQIRDNNPSLLPADNADLITLLSPGERIVINNVRDNDTMQLVGNCVHQIFCCCSKNNDIKLAKDIIGEYGLSAVFSDPSQVIRAWKRLHKFLENTFGKASNIFHERPFVYNKDGKVFTGDMDLVWQTDKGTVLIDFKTYPNFDERHVLQRNDPHYAGIYKGQLDCYSNALKQNGEKVMAKLIYYPVNGMVVEIK